MTLTTQLSLPDPIPVMEAILLCAGRAADHLLPLTAGLRAPGGRQGLAGRGSRRRHP